MGWGKGCHISLRSLTDAAGSPPLSMQDCDTHRSTRSLPFRLLSSSLQRMVMKQDLKLEARICAVFVFYEHWGSLYARLKRLTGASAIHRKSDTARQR